MAITPSGNIFHLLDCLAPGDKGAETNSIDQGTDESFDEILSRAHRNNYAAVMAGSTVDPQTEEDDVIVDGDGFMPEALPKDSDIERIQFRIHTTRRRRA
jgi:hypothetical protein